MPFARGLPHQHETVGVGKWQGFQQGGTYHAEDCCVGANSEGQRQHRDGREAGVLAQYAQAEAEVLHEMVPPHPAARFVEALLGPGDVSEGAPRRHASLFFAQTLLFQLLRLEFEMRFDLCCEVAPLALSPEHRPNPSRPRVPEPARWRRPVAATWSSL